LNRLGELENFHQDIAGLVNINGSGSFVLTEELFRKADNRDALSGVEIDVIKKYDPIGKYVSNSPVLLLHGDSEKVVPIEGQKQFYHYFLQNEKDARVTFHVHRNVNYEFTSEMKLKSFNGLNRLIRSRFLSK
jgi:uncharacterized protein